MKDRVSWRRAWSLFWKLMIMQSAVSLFLMFAYFLWISSAFENLMTEPDSSSQYEECLERNITHPMTEQLCEEYK